MWKINWTADTETIIVLKVYWLGKTSQAIDVNVGIEPFGAIELIDFAVKIIAT